MENYFIVRKQKRNKKGLKENNVKCKRKDRTKVIKSI